MSYSHKGKDLFREWLHDSVMHGLMASGNSMVFDLQIAACVEDIIAPVRGNRPKNCSLTLSDAEAIVVGTARWILKTCGKSDVQE